MLAMILLICVTLFFAAPSGLLVGLIAKKQKDADLLRFARPDASMILTLVPLIFVCVLRSRHATIPPFEPISAVLIALFFIEATLFAYISYRYLLRRSAQKKAITRGRD